MIFARTSLSYTPDGGSEPPMMLLHYRGVLTDAVTREWSSSVSIEPRLGSLYADHRDTGGRYMTMTWTALRRFPSVAMADVWQNERVDYLNTHADGVMEERYGFFGNVATGSKLWRATLVSVTPLPLDPEVMNLHNLTDPEFDELMAAAPDDVPDNAGIAWRALTYVFILTPLG